MRIYQDQLNPVAEVDSLGNIITRFVYGSRGNVPDYLIRDSVVYRYVTDHLGSVSFLVNLSTGAIVQELDYDEFGKVFKNTNESFQPFTYAGGLYDVQTDLIRFGTRDYDPETGRWTTKDPIGFDSGGTNFYAYCLNEPINNTDTYGLKITKIEVSHKTAEVIFYSNTKGIIAVPAALGDPKTPSPAPGTVYYAKGIFKDPVNPKWMYADEPLDPCKNPNNPFGPYIIIVVDKQGNNIHTHIHGTSGGWGTSGDTSYLGGPDPNKRHWTHGCVRTPNFDLREIFKEGVMKNAPIYYK